MSEGTLRSILRWDAMASGLSVVLAIVGARWLGIRLGVETWVPLVVGIALIPWVALLIYVVRQNHLHRGLVAAIAVGNLSWVVVASVLVFGFPEALTTAGRWIVAVFSLIVLDFGLAQSYGLRSLAADPA